MRDTQISLDLAREKIKKYLPLLAISIGLIHIFYTMIRITGYLVSYLVLGIENALVVLMIILLLADFFISISSTEGKNEVKNKVKGYFCREQILLCVFMVLSLVSVFANLEIENTAWFDSNLNAIHDMCISCLLLFPVGRYLAVHGIGKKLKDIISIPLIIMIVILVPVLVEIMQGDMYVPVHDGGGGIIGINSRYQLCLWEHSNTIGMYSAIVVLICLIGIGVCKSWRRVLIFIWSALFLFILVMCNSRASFLSFSLVISLIAALIVYRLFSKLEIWKRWGASALFAVIVFIAFQLFRDGIMFLFDKLTDYSRFMEGEAESFIRDIEPTNLMGRDVIWKGAIDSIFSGLSNMFFGVSPAGVMDEINRYVSWRVYTHNQFLEIAVAIGLPGLICYVTWLAMIANSCLKVGFANNQKISLVRKVVPVIILYLVINNLVEATLVWYRMLSGSVFFFLAGWVSEDGTRFRLASKNSL